jgi:hypothetical protein
MPTITQEYVNQLPDIYRDILSAFPEFDPDRRLGFGLAFQSLYSALEGKYGVGEIRAACEEMQKAGAVEIRERIFVHPTALGEEIIEKLVGQTVPPRERVPPFPLPGAAN